MVVFCLVSFCEHYSSPLPVPGCVQADIIVYLGCSLMVGETSRACGSCVAATYSLLSTLLGPAACGQVGFLFICFAFPRRQVEIISDFTVS